MANVTALSTLSLLY